MIPHLTGQPCAATTKLPHQSGIPANPIPRPILRAAGLAGDMITALTGKPFYITSSRYRIMVTDYITPMDKTYTVLGAPKISLEQGVNETLTWLHTQPEFQSATTP